MTKSDIVERIRSLRYIHVPQASQLFEEACEEIERLRSRPCPYVTGTVTRYCTLTPFTLTDAELEAVERAADALSGVEDCSPDETEKDRQALATLRGLLERLK